MPKVIEQVVRLNVDGEETKAEVVGEIVRCKDCKHGLFCDGFEYGECGLHWDKGKQRSKDFFCADGERKETEDED